MEKFENIVNSIESCKQAISDLDKSIGSVVFADEHTIQVEDERTNGWFSQSGMAKRLLMEIEMLRAWQKKLDEMYANFDTVGKTLSWKPIFEKENYGKEVHYSSSEFLGLQNP